tara:strand:+ start:7 stop:165 length:159 start_codon:yes stop_codon:yes gene_type:complete
MWFGANIYGPFLGKFSFPLTVVFVKRKQTKTASEPKNLLIIALLGCGFFTKS